MFEYIFKEKAASQWYDEYLVGTKIDNSDAHMRDYSLTIILQLSLNT